MGPRPRIVSTGGTALESVDPLGTRDQRPPRHARIRDRSGGRHLPRPRLHLSRRAVHERRSGADQHPDGVCLQLLRAGIRHLRDPERMGGGPIRPATCSGADRCGLVSAHGPDRRRPGIREPRRHPLPVRRRPGRSVSDARPGSGQVVSAQRARPDYGSDVDGRSSRRVACSPADCAVDRPNRLEADVCGLGGGWSGLVLVLLALVSRRSCRSRRR